MSKNCDGCNKDVNEMVFSSSGKYLCYPCYVAEFAPPITVVELWGSDDIIDPLTREVIKGGRDTLFSCGWRLKSSKEYVGIPGSYPYKKILTIKKMFGEKRCPLIRNFSWPRMTGHCINVCCKEQA